MLLWCSRVLDIGAIIERLLVWLQLGGAVEQHRASCSQFTLCASPNSVI